MTIFISGATGFIGRHLVRRLLRDHENSEVICLIKGPVSMRELAAADELRLAGVRVIEGDLDDPEVSWENAPLSLDLVFHLAANIDPGAPDATHRVNDVGTDNLLRWLGGALQGARVVYTSSIAVLDRSGPSDGPLNEASPCVPRTEYGRSKLRGEQVVQRQAAVLGYSYTILRLATVYGPGAKVDGLFDRLFKLNAKHSILGRLNWPGRTSIVHVDDVTAIVSGLARREEAVGEIFCIANPDAPTVGSLAEQIAHLYPEPVDVIHVPDWVWACGRSLAWSRAFQLLGVTVAQTALWRLTLMVDDGFWFDTRKLQTVWSQPPKDLLEGLAEMLKYL